MRPTCVPTTGLTGLACQGGTWRLYGQRRALEGRDGRHEICRDERKAERNHTKSETRDQGRRSILGDLRALQPRGEVSTAGVALV